MNDKEFKALALEAHDLLDAARELEDGEIPKNSELVAIGRMYRILHTFGGRIWTKGADIDQMHAMLLEDNKRMRKAGNNLALAAMRVVSEYDGLHRLSLAIAEWNKAIANEGGRPFIPQIEPDNTNFSSESHS